MRHETVLKMESESFIDQRQRFVEAPLVSPERWYRCAPTHTLHRALRIKREI